MSGLPGLRTAIFGLGLVFSEPLSSEETISKSDSQATAVMGLIDSNQTDRKASGIEKSKLVNKDDDEPFYEQTTYRSTASIMKSLRPKTPNLKKEYLNHFSGTTKPRGTITTRIYIGQDGRVIEAKIIGDSIKDSAFASKTITFFKDLKFDPIKAKVIDSVLIPYSFPPRVK